MPPFKVLIVGGSLAGLALANMLEAYGIPYELLEKHAVIAPPLGASIALLPNGFRILDQIGLYEALERMSVVVDTMTMFDPEGRRLHSYDQYGCLLETM